MTAILRRLTLLALAVAALLSLGCTREARARRVAAEGAALYDLGKYTEALPVLQKARDAGLQDGALLYQIGFLREVVEGKTDERDRTWGEAEPLLEKEIAAAGGATLERLYYLTKINSARGEFDRMRQFGRQAVEQFEKGPSPNTLTGQDWFRLGRVHDLMEEVSEAEAAYRRAMSSFAGTPGTNVAYQTLSLLRVGDLDYSAGRYTGAADEYDQVLKLDPGNKQLKPFNHAITLLAAGRFEQAAARFDADRDGTTSTESQYGADLARKAKETAPLEDKDSDGSSFNGMSYELLTARLKEAAQDYRGVRAKYSMKPGDPLPAEVVPKERRFLGLLREHLVRQKQIQDFCLQAGIADLVRR
ncbi:MAG TPA: hypothetical protein VFT43_03150 [Candidatus Polarisedimenticolia bacterium]|nr:hypothetical protein [Candidatus Polarisedimenticolia bacterium]